MMVIRGNSDVGVASLILLIVSYFAILERMASLDPRMEVVRQTNAGVSSARNAGLKHTSSAQYVLFLDADDVLLPTAIEELVSIAEARPEVIGVHGLAEQSMVKTTLGMSVLISYLG